MFLSPRANFTLIKKERGWIAKVTSSLHDLLPDSKKPCKIKFWERNITLSNPEVNFTNNAEIGIYSCKRN